ncbi:hypothetical protein SESBI_44766 [Sesbania bispinosa]|nr:hypothetical protein SESBI_44766 [Sesbania bispinosa]
MDEKCKQVEANSSNLFLKVECGANSVSVRTLLSPFDHHPYTCLHRTTKLEIEESLLRISCTASATTSQFSISIVTTHELNENEARNQPIHRTSALPTTHGEDASHAHGHRRLRLARVILHELPQSRHRTLPK